jgi:hypothetical protein
MTKSVPALGDYTVNNKPLHKVRNSLMLLGGMLASLPGSAALVELTTATVGPLGTTNAASNSGSDITIDFADVSLSPSSEYYLRFTVSSQATPGNNVAIDNLELFDDQGASVLSSNFNAHDSTDGATFFAGIVWSTAGISDPGAEIPLSTDARVQTDGLAANRDRLAVAWNIDTQGPWSIDIPLTVTVSSLTLSSLQFDYQFITGGGGAQLTPHDGSGVFTASILRPEDVPVPTPIALIALGAVAAVYRAKRSGAMR